MNEDESSLNLIVNQWHLCSHHHLPDWLKDNDYILDGHRPPLLSYSACLRSIFRIHTETVNIWTHLLGCILFTWKIINFQNETADLSFQDNFVIMAYFFGVISCLSGSVVCHTFCCHSPEVCALTTKVDYCGIAMLIMSSLLPTLYFRFYCHYFARIFYMNLTFFLGCYSVYITISNEYLGPDWRPYRTLVFLLFGLSGLIPIAHFEIVEGWTYKQFRDILLMGSQYITGACFYAARIPERWFPGKCDIWFHSHQFFHVFVLVGAFSYFNCISDMAKYRIMAGSCSRYSFT